MIVKIAFVSFSHSMT